MPWKRGIVLIPTQDTTYQAFDMHLAIGQISNDQDFVHRCDGRGTNPHRMFSCLHSWYGGYQVATVEGPRYDGGYQVASRGIARVEGLGGGASKELEYDRHKQRKPNGVKEDACVKNAGPWKMGTS